MRVTVDIEEKTLERVLSMTGEKNKGPALAKAIEEFVNRSPGGKGIEKHFQLIKPHLPFKLHHPGYGGAFVPE